MFHLPFIGNFEMPRYNRPMRPYVPRKSAILLSDESDFAEITFQSSYKENFILHSKGLVIQGMNHRSTISNVASTSFWRWSCVMFKYKVLKSWTATRGTYHCRKTRWLPFHDRPCYSKHFNPSQYCVINGASQ
jgi:hypothetical protein